MSGPPSELNPRIRQAASVLHCQLRAKRASTASPLFSKLYPRRHCNILHLLFSHRSVISLFKSSVEATHEHIQPCCSTRQEARESPTFTFYIQITLATWRLQYQQNPTSFSLFKMFEFVASATITINHTTTEISSITLDASNE